MSNAAAALPSDFREVLQQRLGELERQLLHKVAELEDEKSLLHNETSAHRQKTESALDALLQRVTELERGECRVLCLFLCRPLADVPSGSPTPCLGSWLQCRESWAQSKRPAGREATGFTALLLIYRRSLLGEGVVAPRPLLADCCHSHWNGHRSCLPLISEPTCPRCRKPPDSLPFKQQATLPIPLWPQAAPLLSLVRHLQPLIYRSGLLMP